MMENIDLSKVGQLIQMYCSEDWQYLLNERITRSTYKAKSIIFNEGDKVEYLSIIQTGKVKIFRSYGNGKERIYRFATDGQIIGHRAFGWDFVLPISGRALTNTTTINIPLSLFISLLKANPQFCYHFMLFFAEELKKSERRMKNLTQMDLRQRVGNAILTNAEVFGFDDQDHKKLAFTISRKDMSHLAATTYESVIRVLAEFQNSNIIQLVKKDIRIVNIQELISIVTLTTKATDMASEESV